MAMMTAGTLRHRVTLQTAGVPVPDGDGAFTQVWTNYPPARRSAQVAPTPAREMERLRASGVGAHASHLVTIRYQAGVTTAMRLLFHDADGDRTLSITGVQDVGARHVWLALTCIEAVA